jgi:hypothetical protein
MTWWRFHASAMAVEAGGGTAATDVVIPSALVAVPFLISAG